MASNKFVNIAVRPEARSQIMLRAKSMDLRAYEFCELLLTAWIQMSMRQKQEAILVHSQLRAEELSARAATGKNKRSKSL